MERLLEHLRSALVDLLSQGTWQDIQQDHDRIGLAWREDFEPGWGKPKYVDRVLRDLSDDEVLAVAEHSLSTFDNRSLISVQDAVWSLEARGERALSPITRTAFAAALDGHRLHPREDARILRCCQP